MVKDWLERSMMTSMALDFSSTIWSSGVRSLPGRGRRGGEVRLLVHANQCGALTGVHLPGDQHVPWVLHRGACSLVGKNEPVS